MTKLPHSSFFAETRTLIKHGNSFAVTIPVDFVKTLDERNLKVINLNNNYIICFAEKMSVDDSYDLLQLILTVLEALYAVEREDIKKIIVEAYEKLVELVELQGGD